MTPEQRCRLAFLQGIRDHEERIGRPLTAEEDVAADDESPCAP
jgi:hypothetical protein